jgi:DsbC/DsbD-like thiol-disulfide interchange protein
MNHRILAAGALGLASALAQVLPARAADASPWVADLHSEFRLIAGAAKTNDAPLRAGIEIKMQPGWHTYWRYAGDSGVPPRFDFSGSQNLASAKVRYPAPHLFTDETGNTLGYTGGVIFPVEVRPKDPNVPVTLRVKLDYAICAKLCVPVEGRAELVLLHGDSVQDAALAAAEARVPQPVSADALGLSARRVHEGPKPLVAVDLKAPAGKPIQIFVEGPTPEWALPIPKPAPGAPEGHQHFGFELDGLPPGVDPKGQFELTFTVIDGERAYEARTRLD